MKSLLIRTGSAVLLLSLALSCRAAVNFVQEADTAARSVSTVKLSFRASTTAGNLIVVAVLSDAARSVSAVVDSQGNPYTAVASPAVGSASSGSTQVFYARNIHGGADTVTVTLSGHAWFADVYLHEYTGADLTNPLDAATGAGGTGRIGNSGSVVTSSPSDLIFGACTDGGGAPSPGTGFTLRSLRDNNITEDLQAAAAGAYVVTVQIGGTYDWTCQLAAFCPAGNTPAATTESVTLSGKFNWDTGAAIQGSVSLFQQAASGDVKLGQWTIGSTGTVSAALML